jgi:uncharacterized protein (TIGR01777 family)
MKILITGATGFIAQNFINSLKNEKDIEFILLTTHPIEAKTLYNNIANTTIIDSISENTPTPDVVINLAGSPIIQTSFRIQSSNDIRTSRINYTQRLCADLKKFNIFPKIFLSASAAAIYGSKKTLVSEKAQSLGGSFLGNLVMDWEASTYEGCKGTHARVVTLRFATILASNGGIYQTVKPLFELGLGATVGNGRQYFPWVSLNDAIRAIVHIINTETIKGPVNIAVPANNTQKQFSEYLAHSIGKKVFLRIPKLCIKFAQGDIASVFTDSLVMTPSKLLNNGFLFKDTELDKLLNQLAKESAEIQKNE